ncbi:MAG: hypothetical protein ICV55_10445 [Coleofasciculus sp. C3-bin4]|nr:hypothetical protein [Coleofasciculus sp. C3-bin4]
MFRPTLDDWIVDDGEILSLSNRIDPPYLYLVQENKVKQTITLSIPSLLQPGQILKSWLRFPGIQEEAIFIQVEILSPEPEKDKHQVVEVPLPVTLPLTSQGVNSFSNTLDQTTAGIFGLLSGLIDLDKIPSRWLVAELLVILCQRGEEYAQTEPGNQLLNQLKTTRFFQNGVIAFASAQIPNWIADSLKGATIILGGQSLLYLWEQWLLSLVPADIEADQKKAEISVPPFLAETFVSKLGGSADRWFAGIVLGLTLISPRIAAVAGAIATQSPRTPTLEDNKAGEASYSLATGLLGLDKLPARWLVVELLLILCQKGHEYARTQQGSQLLKQLSRTRFLENGILALASAQAPRWLTISHSAAAAFHSSLGMQTGQGGLVYIWEQWLWSLIPAELKAGELKTEILVPPSPGEALVAQLSMDAQRWFASSVLGLTLISPRIAATVEAIAAQAPAAAVKMPPPLFSFNDVIGVNQQ